MVIKIEGLRAFYFDDITAVLTRNSLYTFSAL